MDLKSAWPSKVLFLTIGAGYLGITHYMGTQVTRANFGAFIIGYAGMFALYGAALWHGVRSGTTWWAYIGLGIAARLLLLCWGTPNLSDDVYRFLWDGRLTMAGYNPFAHPPDWFLENRVGVDTSLYGHLNSPHYYSVYPPVCQWVFATAAWVAPQNAYWGIKMIQLFLFCCEMGTFYLLTKGIYDLRFTIYDCPPKTQSERAQSSIVNRQSSILLYALNPLVLLEIVGNCHFEGAVTVFTLAALYALGRQPGSSKQGVFAALFLALAVSSKLVPLLFVPLVARWIGGWKGILMALCFAAFTGILFVGWLDWDLVANMAKSLDLYFQKFAFNASFYYLAWEIGLWCHYYKMDVTLGPAFGVLQIGLMAWFFWRLKPRSSLESLQLAMIAVLGVYLFGASTVHPWYVVPFFALHLSTGVASPHRPFWYAFAWTGTAAFSYSHYQDGAFVEQKGWIALEYAVVFVIWIGEWIQLKLKRRNLGTAKPLLPPAKTFP